MTKRERDKMIVNYLPLAESEACRAHKRATDVDLDDLKSEAYVGLCRAAEDWNPELGSFGTYSWWWIRHYLGRYVHSERMSRGDYTSEDCATWDIDANDRASDRVDAAISVERMISTLDERDREILRYRYGLDDGQPRTLREVGERYGVVGSTILRAERRIIEALRGAND